MTDNKKRLADIRSRLERATPAPWRPAASAEIVCEHNPFRIVAVVRDARDQAFIAHAPEDIAWLLDLLQRQAEELGSSYGGGGGAS
jgi:hypothetical protein